MTLTQLKYVITIADTGSMNEAAKLLFISQPSLSLALKKQPRRCPDTGRTGVLRLRETGNGTV